jgi:antitoxin MazE
LKAEIIRIGNSQGVRIPKPILKQCRLEGVVEMDVEGGRLVISAASQPRSAWSDEFRKMAQAGDDMMLLGEEAATSWDAEEWHW